MMKTVSRAEITDLQQIPNIGPSISANLRLIGVLSPHDLLGKDPYKLYDDLCQTTGVRQDPCVIDVFIAAVRFMAGEPAKRWWKYTPERKRTLAESRERQEAAFQDGLIPSIPADTPADRTPIMDDQTSKPADAPSLHSVEGGLFDALFGFHKKVVTMLRAANLPDDKVGVVSERISYLLNTTTQEIKRTQDLNIQPRMDATYEEVKRLVDEVVKLGSIRDQMEKIYSEMPPADIPWNIELPPKALTELVESGQVQPCKTIDLGCGAGNYGIYLAGLGFDVTGVDISPSAIARAKANAKQKGVACRFLIADVLSSLPEITETFEFAYDWSLLHHVFPLDRKRYAETVHRLLVPGGKYLSVCFSEKDAEVGGMGKVRRTPLGTMLYFSSEDELRDTFAPGFDVRILKTVQIEGKREPHSMNFAFMEKKQVVRKKGRGRSRK